MKEIASGVYYCGLHDKNRKLFDQLVPLPQGTTYNSYLVKGAQKCALIDTMYEKLLDPYRDMLSACGLKIDYIVSNHAEPDHSGAIPTLLEAYPEAARGGSVPNESCSRRRRDRSWRAHAKILYDALGSLAGYDVYLPCGG